MKDLLTKEQAIKNHREMWNWLAETGKEKEDYFKHLGTDPEEIPVMYCWLCEYDTQRRRQSTKYNFVSCRTICLLQWSNGGCSTDEFGQWALAWDIRKKHIAKIIANLPEREE